MSETPRVTRQRRPVTRERRMTQRGDKVIPLDQRLLEIEATIISLDKRVDKLVILMTILVGISHLPNLGGMLSQLLDMLK